MRSFSIHEERGPCKTKKQHHLEKEFMCCFSESGGKYLRQVGGWGRKVVGKETKQGGGREGEDAS